jgi:YVTN family beta-propeller protein
MKRLPAIALRKSIVTTALWLLTASMPIAAQTLVTTVTAGAYPVAIAVNPATNKIYVVNQNSNNMTVIDGATYNTNTVLTGNAPDAVAVNAATNKIYAANGNSNSVTVVNGTTNRTATVAVGDYPLAIAVNAVTNKIYVANYYSNSVTVIDGTTNKTTTVSVGSNPFAVAVNSATNEIYVADSGSNSVAIIDGANNSTTMVSVGAYPRAIAIDPYANKIYAVNYSSNDVSVIDGVTNLVTNVTVGTGPSAVAVNPASSQAYVTNSGSGTATIIDETTLATTTVIAGSSPNAIDVNVVTNKAYLTNNIWDGTVTLVNGADDSTASISLGNATWPTAIAVNPLTNTVFVANTVGNSISVIAGAGADAVQFLPVTPCRVADTRQTNGPFGGPYLGGGTSRSFAVPQSSCDIPSTAIAYSLNVTVVPVQGHALEYLTIWPTGLPQPLISTLNSLDGRVKANAAIVPAGAGGAVSVYATDSTNVILDINGYFQLPASSTLQFYPLTPCRVVDTRNAPGELGGPYLQGAQERDFPVLSSTCQIPSNAQAYSMNITVVPVGVKPLGYLSVWPAGLNQPVVSALNNPTATIVANAAIVPAGTSGAIAVYADQDTQLVIDINGYFAAPASGGLSLYPAAPCRVIDTRSTGGAFSGQRNPPVNVAASGCNPPGTAQGYVFNATVIPAGSLGYLTLWADGGQQPIVSTLNAADGEVTSNMAIVGNQDGKTDAYAYGTTQLLMDISSYFAP